MQAGATLHQALSCASKRGRGTMQRQRALRVVALATSNSSWYLRAALHVGRTAAGHSGMGDPCLPLGYIPQACW
jgi:hypothetical protein